MTQVTSTPWEGAPSVDFRKSAGRRSSQGFRYMPRDQRYKEAALILTSSKPILLWRGAHAIKQLDGADLVRRLSHARRKIEAGHQLEPHRFAAVTSMPQAIYAQRRYPTIRIGEFAYQVLCDLSIDLTFKPSDSKIEP